MSHHTFTNKAWHTYEWGMAHIWNRHGTRMTEAWHTHTCEKRECKWVSHVHAEYTYIYIYIYVCVFAGEIGVGLWWREGVWMSHVTNVNELHYTYDMCNVILCETLLFHRDCVVFGHRIVQTPLARRVLSLVLIYINIHANIHAYWHTNMQTYMHTDIQTCIHFHVCTCVCIYISMYAFIYTYICIHVYTYKYIYVCGCWHPTLQTLLVCRCPAAATQSRGASKNPLS